MAGDLGFEPRTSLLESTVLAAATNPLQELITIIYLNKFVNFFFIFSQKVSFRGSGLVGSLNFQSL